MGKLLLFHALRRHILRNRSDEDLISCIHGRRSRKFCLSVRQKDDGLILGLPKNRESKKGITLKYLWNINIGEFIYTESAENYSKEEVKERRERKKQSGKDVF